MRGCKHGQGQVRQVHPRTRLGKGHSGDILCAFVIARGYFYEGSSNQTAGRAKSSYAPDRGWFSFDTQETRCSR